MHANCRVQQALANALQLAAQAAIVNGTDADPVVC